MMTTFAFLALFFVLQGIGAQNVDPTQLEAWRGIFDATNGNSWSKCGGKRDNPCDCTGTIPANVNCTTQNGVRFITSIRLKNNNLVAQSFPSVQVNTIVGAASFVSIDMRNNPKLRNPGNACLEIPNCAGKTCNFDFDVCGTASTKAPTGAPTVGVTAAWSSFFSATGGKTWVKCSRTDTTPCQCQPNQPEDSPIRVVCTGTKPTRISLIANNLIANEFPSKAVNDMIAAGVTFIDLRNNTQLAPQAACFDVPLCASGVAQCNFPKPVCQISTTASPSSSPITFSTPTTSSPSSSPGTQTSTTPTTESPTTTAPPFPVVPPVSSAPSTSPVVSSTTSPSTSPSISVGGKTGVPTSSPNTRVSLAPSASPGTTPTRAGNVTFSPTIRTGNVTSSPTRLGVLTVAPSASAAETAGVSTITSTFISLLLGALIAFV